MIKVTIELLPKGLETNKRVLGTIIIVNTGTGDLQTGNYNGVLNAEYTKPEGRLGSVNNFNRQTQSVWSLVGAFLKLWGHTKHPQHLMQK